MPTYDYRCAACDHTYELFQSMSDRPARKCPKCGKLKAVRLIGSGSTVIFKGSGFYQTDYRSEEYKSRLKKEKDTTSTTGSKDKKAKKKKNAKD